ncbi:thiol-activated cytolysin family protein [Streptomyces sp. ISL-66]|uniref:thiol-activated cytolysin family protein n=1 Tax=Streptomyces sp. ISL-66 TaxID=2819186 RepID=UPI001BEB4FA7|nr:thiol-activated cytolysin family protein [Streptomyces sp. ISL-66]MBT2468363.1 thiol-activated cytolysin family protein [Streptomyces sp. ISL-66]
MDELRNEISITVDVRDAAVPPPFAPSRSASHDAWTRALWPQGRPEEPTGEGAGRADDEEEGGGEEGEKGTGEEEEKGTGEEEKEGEERQHGEEHVDPGERAALPKYFKCESRNYDSSRALLLDFGISARYLTISGDAQASLEQHSEETTIYAMLWHEAYNVVCDTITPHNVFREDVTLEQLKEYQPRLGPGNPPVYVRSVTYGRYLVLAFHSKVNSSLAEAALQFGFTGKVADVSGHASTAVESVLKESHLTVLAVGGRMENIEQLLKDQKLVSSFSGKDSPLTVGECVPIRYTLAALADGETAEIPETVEYAETTVTEDFAFEISDQSRKWKQKISPAPPFGVSVEGRQVFQFPANTEPTKLGFEAFVEGKRCFIPVAPADFRTSDTFTKTYVGSGSWVWEELTYTAKKLSPRYV